MPAAMMLAAEKATREEKYLGKITKKFKVIIIIKKIILNKEIIIIILLT